MIDTKKMKKTRKPREVTEFNIWMKHCLIRTMKDNRDIDVTTPKVMETCAFAHRNRSD